jgi:hypothetical protein
MKTAKKTSSAPKNKTKKSYKTYVVKYSDMKYHISKKEFEKAKLNTFSISKPYIKRKYTFQNIRPVVEKLIQYGLDENKIEITRDIHAKINCNNLDISLIYLFVNKRYWLEIMVQNINKTLSKDKYNKLRKIVDHGDIKEYTTIASLYSDIVKLQSL